MKYLLLGMFLLAGGLVEAKDVRCVCNDHTVKRPDCGICGTDAGTMLLTEDGVECICSNQLKLKTISCRSVCLKNEGWSGDLLVR
jgi:hypothetical protein